MTDVMERRKSSLEKGIQFCTVDIPVIELLMERYTEKSDNVA